jgi:diacylglycerol O-acyltransferase-1
MKEATVTGVEPENNANNTSEGPVRRSKATSSPPEPNGKTDDATDELRRSFVKKYRHVVAVHSKSRPSTLSHDAKELPSFLGFRNLMVIVLVVGNLRLVIENIQKVRFLSRIEYMRRVGLTTR